MWISRGLGHSIRSDYPPNAGGAGANRAAAIRSRARTACRAPSGRHRRLEGLEIGVALRERAVLGVERDCAFEVCDGFGRFAALGVRNRQHVQRVIVVGVFVANQPQVCEGLVVAPAVDSERRRIQTLFLRLRGGLLRLDLAVADVQVLPDAFVQLLFLGILTQDALECLGCPFEIMPLQCPHPALVKCDRLDVRHPVLRSPGRRLRRGVTTGEPVG